MKNILTQLLFVAQIFLSQVVFSDTQDSDTHDSDNVLVTAYHAVPAQFTSYNAGVSFVESETSISLDFSLDKNKDVFSEFKVVTDEGEIFIPDGVLQKLISPQLSTIRVTYLPISVDHPDWTFTLIMDFSDFVWSEERGREYSQVEFFFDRNKLIEVVVFDAENNDSILYDIYDDEDVY